MVWAGFSSYGILEMQIVGSRMKSYDYIQVLKSSLLTYIHQFKKISFVFQHDNARIHVSRETLSWLKEKNINFLEWIPCSPDINPIENLWGVIVRRIYSNNKQFENCERLKSAIIEAWLAIDTELLKSLVNSMDNRIFQLIQRSGGLTDY